MCFLLSAMSLIRDWVVYGLYTTKVRWWVLLELVNANITVHYPSNHFRRTWNMRRLYFRVTYLRMSFFLKKMNIRLQVFLNKSRGKHFELKTKWHGDWEYYIMLNVIICICTAVFFLFLFHCRYSHLYFYYPLTTCSILYISIGIGYRNNFTIHPCTPCIYCLSNKCL